MKDILTMWWYWRETRDTGSRKGTSIFLHSSYENTLRYAESSYYAISYTMNSLTMLKNWRVKEKSGWYVLKTDECHPYNDRHKKVGAALLGRSWGGETVYRGKPAGTSRMGWQKPPLTRHSKIYGRPADPFFLLTTPLSAQTYIWKCLGEDSHALPEAQAICIHTRVHSWIPWFPNTYTAIFLPAHAWQADRPLDLPRTRCVFPTRP